MLIDPTSVQLSYLAGIFDSDGHITIHKSTRKGKSYYAPVIGITGTRRQPHDLAASIWGGKVWLIRPSNARHRLVFIWARQGRSALPIITAVRKYLLVKCEQADLALSIYDQPSVGYMEDARQEMIRVLNQDKHAPRPGA